MRECSKYFCLHTLSHYKKGCDVTACDNVLEEEGSHKTCTKHVNKQNNKRFISGIPTFCVAGQPKMLDPGLFCTDLVTARRIYNFWS